MPRLDTDMQTHAIGRGFAFTGVRIEKLGATDYTLVTIGVDVTGSVEGFEDQLLEMIKKAVDGCRKSPRSENILVRVFLFSDRFKNGISEVHGFKPLVEIDTGSYAALTSGGWTPLNDAAYSAIGATTKYAEAMHERDYESNGIFFLITDGAENASVASMKMVKDEFERAKRSEILESVISVLIGVNNAQYKAAQEQFVREAGITHFIDVGDVTERKLAKLAAFVSTSVSSQALARGSGGPSQNISATI